MCILCPKRSLHPGFQCFMALLERYLPIACSYMLHQPRGCWQVAGAPFYYLWATPFMRRQEGDRGRKRADGVCRYAAPPVTVYG